MSAEYPAITRYKPIQYGQVADMAAVPYGGYVLYTEYLKLENGLRGVAKGSFPDASDYVLTGNWKGAYEQLQVLAISTLRSIWTEEIDSAIEAAAKRLCYATGLDWELIPEAHPSNEDRNYYRTLARAALAINPLWNPPSQASSAPTSKPAIS